MTTKLKVLQNKILVAETPTEKVSELIVVSGLDPQVSNTGTVVAVGPGLRLPDGKREPLAVNLGDKVLFGTYIGETVKDGEDKYLVMTDLDVLAVIEE
jgi:chaperonin GroES